MPGLAPTIGSEDPQNSALGDALFSEDLLDAQIGFLVILRIEAIGHPGGIHLLQGGDESSLGATLRPLGEDGCPTADSTVDRAIGNVGSGSGAELGGPHGQVDEGHRSLLPGRIQIMGDIPFRIGELDIHEGASDGYPSVQSVFL